MSQDDVVPAAPDPKQQELERVTKELEELKQAFDNIQNQFKRAVADYHNLEKRVQEGRSELAHYVGASLVTQIVPTLDHLDTALAGASEEEKRSGWFKGVEMAIKQLKATLKEEGLEEIVADGQFDPARHEAVDTQEGENNTILKVVAKGYSLNGKVIKPAKVVVGKENINKA